MASSHNVELEAAKFLHKLIQDSKDEPAKLATKLYVILQHMKSSGKEHSMPYQVISRAMETVINQNGLDIEALKSSRLPLTGNTPTGDSTAQYMGSSQAVGVTKDSKAGLADNELPRVDAFASSRPPVGPSSAGHDIYQGSVSHRSGKVFDQESPSSLDSRSANSQSQERRDTANWDRQVNQKDSKKASAKRKRADSSLAMEPHIDNPQVYDTRNTVVNPRKGKLMNKVEPSGSFSVKGGAVSKVQGGMAGVSSSYPVVESGFSSPMQCSGSSYDNHGLVAKMHNERSVEAFSAVSSPLVELSASKGAVDSEHWKQGFMKGAVATTSDKTVEAHLFSANRGEEVSTTLSSSGKVVEHDGGIPNMLANANRIVQVALPQVVIPAEVDEIVGVQVTSPAPPGRGKSKQVASPVAALPLPGVEVLVPSFKAVSKSSSEWESDSSEESSGFNDEEISTDVEMVPEPLEKEVGSVTGGPNATAVAEEVSAILPSTPLAPIVKVLPLDKGSGSGRASVKVTRDLSEDDDILLVRSSPIEVLSESDDSLPISKALGKKRAGESLVADPGVLRGGLLPVVGDARLEEMEAFEEKRAKDLVLDLEAKREYAFGKEDVAAVGADLPRRSGLGLAPPRVTRLRVTQNMPVSGDYQLVHGFLVRSSVAGSLSQIVTKYGPVGVACTSKSSVLRGCLAELMVCVAQILHTNSPRTLSSADYDFVKDGLDDLEEHKFKVDWLRVHFDRAKPLLDFSRAEVEARARAIRVKELEFLRGKAKVQATLADRAKERARATLPPEVDGDTMEEYIGNIFYEP